MDPRPFQQALLAWHARFGRHDLPWKCPPDPYRVWVSEIMLQQTQVATVIPYFQRFMARFPTLSALAESRLDEVLALWSGLGYYARARNLHACARYLMTEHGGEWPREVKALMALPGIGRSTAGAILAQAFDLPHPILDGNAKRVLARRHAVEGWPGQAQVNRRLWALAEHYTPSNAAAAYTQAIMDLGAMICTRRAPRCSVCPVQEGCQARMEGRPQDYPSPRPRKRLPRRESRWLLVEDHQGRVLLQRRPSAGLWGGLWTPLELPLTEEDPQRWAEARWGLRVSPPRPLEPLDHLFTHFRLRIQPLHASLQGTNAQIMEPSETLWYNGPSRHDIGLPSPVQALLKRTRGKT